MISRSLFSCPPSLFSLSPCNSIPHFSVSYSPTTFDQMRKGKMRETGYEERANDGQGGEKELMITISTKNYPHQPIFSCTIPKVIA